MTIELKINDLTEEDLKEIMNLYVTSFGRRLDSHDRGAIKGSLRALNNQG